MSSNTPTPVVSGGEPTSQREPLGIRKEEILPGPPFAPEGPKEFARTLLRRLWITKGVRFEGARRLEAKQRSVDLAISLLSVYVIAFTLIHLLVPRDAAPLLTAMYPLVTIVAPILVMVLSQHESGKRYLIFGDRLMRSAHKIQALYSELEMLSGLESSPPREALERIRSEYEQILSDVSFIQEQIDYRYFQSLHSAKFKKYGWLEQTWRHFSARTRRLVDTWLVLGVTVIIGAFMLWPAVQALLQNLSSRG